jgi:hypothetical protein
MPTSILTYLKLQSFLEVRYAQKAIWDAYENDFGKKKMSAYYKKKEYVITNAGEMYDFLIL